MEVYSAQREGGSTERLTGWVGGDGWTLTHGIVRHRHWGTRFILFIFVSPGPNSVPGATRCYLGNRKEEEGGEKVGEGDRKEAERSGDVQ